MVVVQYFRNFDLISAHYQQIWRSETRYSARLRAYRLFTWVDSRRQVGEELREDMSEEQEYCRHTAAAEAALRKLDEMG